MAPKVLNFITGNANKLAEVRDILSNVPDLELRNQAVDLPEMQGTIEEISREKCRRAAEEVSCFLCLLCWVMRKTIDFYKLQKCRSQKTFEITHDLCVARLEDLSLRKIHACLLMLGGNCRDHMCMS